MERDRTAFDDDEPAPVKRGKVARLPWVEEEPEPPPEIFRHPLNDLGNAERLVAQHGAALRYVVNIGWHVWDGKRYRHDPAEVAARTLAHDTARAMLTAAFDMPGRTKEQEEQKKTIIKFAIGSGNAAKTASMLSQAEPSLAVETDDLDRDPWLLNCANGTLDLRTRELRPHSQGDLMTKLSPVAYDPDAKCPIWERIMGEIFGGDTDMVDYVQRALGYCLTGLTTEQVVFIMHGGGSNGKSLMLEIVAAVLADYAAQCPSDTFVEKKNGGGIPNDIARLVGARFVSVVETEQDTKLAEGLVKQATGGDRITARFMRQEFFEFIPKFKLAMATNHKPRVRGTDNAIWRRIRLLPFLVTFVDPDGAKEGDHVKDYGLKDKLMNELDGVLRWMVDGCEQWQKEGLTKAPKTVMEATTEYRESQDATAGFIEECCHVSPGLRVKVGKLYKSYRNWCDGAGETALSSNAFGMALEEKGYPAKRGGGGARERIGLNLKLEFDLDAENDEQPR
jgi:putative DNA primase/helicase